MYSPKAQKFIIAIALLFLSMLLCYLFIEFGWIVIEFVDGLFILLLILIVESRSQISHNMPSVLVPLMLLIIPIQAVLVRTIPILLASQLSIFLVILFYLQIYSPQGLLEYKRKIRPLILPTTAFAFSIILSYLIAGDLQRNDWVFLLSLLGSLGYAYLAAIYCKDMHNIQKILWLLIGIGVVQLPFLYAQSRGWTDWLPANLHMFTSIAWGGTASSVSVVRYGGMFGDYELLAEYLDIAVLFSAGILMVTPSRKERFFALLSIVLLLTAGFYTGTRTFILGLGIGLAVMFFLMVIRPGFSKNVVIFLMIVIIFILALYFLSSQEVFSGYISRFLKIDIRPGYYDTRTAVWTISFSMMQNIPFTGYGASMMNIFASTGNSLRIFSSPHSFYFYMFLTAGYPGLIAAIILILTPVMWILRVLFNKSIKVYQTWAIIIMGVWCFWIVNEIKIEFTRYPFYMNILFFIFGIAASFYDLARMKSNTH